MYIPSPAVAAVNIFIEGFKSYEMRQKCPAKVLISLIFTLTFFQRSLQQIWIDDSSMGAVEISFNVCLIDEVLSMLVELQ